ncbi:hypothetical protein LTR78_003023 [Recurvomyces mirabilis]|uniref:Uncharacterized protein n=1 Tax=Recurvomyces mirabilis TaxID=574656 RepID=A0AAE1C3U8_9PEZI|nr:hypothetical protein LTR78_003023 [Recurvomyces mirabilis]KAK5157156.1 hypothetical protein LTS14_004674 [Recurvomyces mirabilis]
MSPVLLRIRGERGRNGIIPQQNILVDYGVAKRKGETPGSRIGSCPTKVTFSTPGREKSRLQDNDRGSSLVGRAMSGSAVNKSKFIDVFFQKRGEDVEEQIVSGVPLWGTHMASEAEAFDRKK